MFVAGCGTLSTKKNIFLSVKSVAVAFRDDDMVFDTDEVYEFREYNTYENKGAEKQRTINVPEGEMTGEYIYSYSDPFTRYDIDVYINEKTGVMFEVEKNTEHVLGCRDEAGIDVQQFSDMTSKEELLLSLDAFVEQIIDKEGFEPVINTQVLSEKMAKPVAEMRRVFIFQSRMRRCIIQ